MSRPYAPDLRILGQTECKDDCKLLYWSIDDYGVGLGQAVMGQHTYGGFWELCQV